ncbi:glycosidase [Clostridium beijerinckii]|nr:glycosidase [Clostridium beijerinckii]
MNKKTFGGKDLLTVGETWGCTTEIAKKYSNPDDSELSMIFQFEHILLDQQPGKEKWDLKPLELLDLKKALSRWQVELEGTGWNSLFWNNHDVPRIVSRWGNDKEYRVESAKMLATLLHGMKGTPYIYQGEELGMTNVRFESLEDYKDIETLNMYNERKKQGYTHEDIMLSIYTKGRDNARTPMQWDDSQNAGFTSGQPWLKVNPNYKEINAELQLKDENSIFNYYKKLIKIRKSNPVVVYGKYELMLEENKEIFAYTRTLENEMLLVICNFTGNETEFVLERKFEFKSKELLISNYNVNENDSIDSIELKPYESRIYKFIL